MYYVKSTHLPQRLVFILSTVNIHVSCDEYLPPGALFTGLFLLRVHGYGSSRLDGTDGWIVLVTSGFVFSSNPVRTALTEAFDLHKGAYKSRQLMV